MDCYNKYRVCVFYGERDYEFFYIEAYDEFYAKLDAMDMYANFSRELYYDEVLPVFSVEIEQVEEF
ncbi:hypothetical protein LP114_081 [Listeria phage LP-114]|uniref:Uncharacterized protein n=1 Tax=Listeria phage LP-114 TaxID=1458857 RepID=A0A059T644_9CAUD|nr:hypothetical protein LP114_081 [Listeria phage LP-114]AHL18669.1 hypothetical protein LP114_081 [Listeria phage LP-114]